MASYATIRRLPRFHKARVTRLLHDNLSERMQNGPAEPALDAFVPKLLALAARLEAHLDGKAVAQASHTALADRLEKADVQVDAYCRHIEGFLDTEAHRRSGPHVPSAKALYTLLFPRGRAFVDDHIPQQNGEVRRILHVLRSPEVQPLLTSIAFPFAWLSTLQEAVDESDAAYREKALARGEAAEHVSFGREAEDECVDLLTRLRKAVEARTPRGDAEAEAEAKTLLTPLLQALAHQKSVARLRATVREKQKVEKEAEGTASADASHACPDCEWPFAPSPAPTEFPVPLEAPRPLFDPPQGGKSR